MAARNFRNLVFEGGGVKGIAYGGALDVLNEMGILNKIERVGGTSAGAINAALLATGHSTTEISEIISNTDFSAFADGGSIFTKIPRLLKRYGINKGDVFSRFIRDKIGEKTQNPDLTFNQLSKRVEEGEPGLRNLYIITTDLTRQKPVIFSHEGSENSDTPIWLAVRMSMGIPIYFQSVFYKNSVLVDGGVSYNYAVNIFDNKKYLSNQQNGKYDFYPDDKIKVFNYETLGFRLDSRQVIKYSHDNWAIPPEKIENIKQFSGALLNFMMEMANKSHLLPEDWNRTVFIDTLDVRTTDFHINRERINALIRSGRNCTKLYFDWREKEPIWNVYPE
ncbi:MAG TPA: patatin-like phospholipase family protein [Bacteroidales bacterium]|nr:patatin-like phospholipase family protein [Bacteroidales bacterium]